MRYKVLRYVMLLVGTACAISEPASAAPPKPPAVLVGAGEVEQRVELTLEHPVLVLPGWMRFDAQVAPGVLAQAYVSQTTTLVDVFNVGATPIRIAFEGVAGDLLEYDRTVPTWCGISWSSSPPTRSAEAPAGGPWDSAYPVLPWAKVDVGWTMTTGSPRNRFFSEHRWRAARGGVTRAMEAWLDRYVRWQTQRSYQQPDPLRAFPRTMLGLAPAGGKPVTYPTLGTVLPGDTHHWTVGVLADAFLLTGDPRALDQLTRAMSWALATQDYYRVDWPYPYGGAERVPGWLLVSFADAAEAFDAAGYASLVEWCQDHASAHVENLERLGFNELGLPNIVTAPDPGRHLSVPFNAPWQGATVAHGLLRVDQVLGVPGARELAQRWLDYLERDGWNGINTAWDSIPHEPADQAVARRAAGVPGIGMWLAPPLILGGRSESPLLAFIVGKAKATKSSGQVLFSPGGSLSLFAPILP